MRRSGWGCNQFPNAQYGHRVQGFLLYNTFMESGSLPRAICHLHNDSIMLDQKTEPVGFTNVVCNGKPADAIIQFYADFLPLIDFFRMQFQELELPYPASAEVEKVVHVIESCLERLRIRESIIKKWMGISDDGDATEDYVVPHTPFPNCTPDRSPVIAV